MTYRSERPQFPWKKYGRDYYERHKEERLAYQRAYYQAHREEIKRKVVEWRKARIDREKRNYYGRKQQLTTPSDT
jgi:hypothetical protein